MSQENSKHLPQMLPNFGYSEAEHLPEDLYTSQSSVKNVLGEKEDFDQENEGFFCGIEGLGGSRCAWQCNECKLKDYEEEEALVEDVEVYKQTVYEDAAKLIEDCRRANEVPANLNMENREDCEFLPLDDYKKKKLILGDWKPGNTNPSENKDRSANEA